MDEQQSARQKLMKELGYKPLNRLWAKTEILLGLVAVFAGLMLGLASAIRVIGPLVGVVVFVYFLFKKIIISSGLWMICPAWKKHAKN